MFRDQGVAGQSSLCRPRVVLPAPHPLLEAPTSLSLWPPHSGLCLCLAVAPLTLVTVQPSLL